MRIQIVTSEYTGVTTYSGGIGTQYANLAPALADYGCELHVVTVGEDRSAAIERDGVRILRVKVARSAGLRPLKWPLAARRALGRLPPPDVVVAADYAAGAAAYAMGRTRAPLITHLHGSLAQVIASSRWSRRRRMLPQTLVQLALERLQAQRSDGLLSPSVHLLEWAREIWPIQRLPAEVVPNAVDVERLRRLAHGLPPPELAASGPLVVFAGRLEQRKGVHVLVEAMRTVWAEHPDVALVLAGGADGEWHGGPMSDHLRRLAGEHQDRLLLPGHLSAERLFPLVASADVVALPSLWEPFSLGALEAMALGRPLVATTDVFPPFVEDGRTALLVPPGEPAPLAEAIGRLLSDRELGRRLGEEGRVTAAEHDVVPSARRFVEALGSLTGRRR